MKKTILSLKEKKLLLLKTMICSCLWGLICHGEMIFNKFCVHDDIQSAVGMIPGFTYSLGRWAGGLFQEFLTTFLPGDLCSTPTFNGVLSFLCVGFIVFILFCIFDIEKNIYIVLLTGIFVCSPVVLMLFGYMHFVPIYFPGLILISFGCYIGCKASRNLANRLISIFLIAIGIGFYQCFFAMAVSIFLLYILEETAKEKYSSFKFFFKDCGFYLSILILSLALYLIINQIILMIMQINLSDYAGLSTMGITSITEYVKRIIDAYKCFILAKQNSLNNLYPLSTRYLYWLILGFLALISLHQVYLLYKKNIVYAVQYVLILALFPLALYVMIIIAGSDVVCNLHLFSVGLLYVFLCLKLDAMPENYIFVKRIRVFGLLLVFCMNVSYVYYSNECYFKEEITQEETIQWMNRLAMRIESTDGYTEGMSVVYINEYSKQDTTLASKKLFDKIASPMPYNMGVDELINNYNWKEYMSLWIGFEPNVLSADGFESMNEVEQMPHYPDCGSIQVIDDTVVVKF